MHACKTIKLLVMGKKSVLFFSSVKTKKMFSIQSYYRNDIIILKELGYDVHLCNSILDFACFWRYSVAFIYFYRYGLLAAMFAKLFRKRVYFTGGIDYLEPSFATPRQRLAQAVMFKICNCLSNTSILVSSSDCRNVAALYGGKLPRNCRLCYHVIDVARFLYTPDVQKKHGQFLLVAWMQNIDNVCRKGIDKAVKVFKAIPGQHPESRLILAGPSGEGSEYVTSLVNKLGLGDSVTYLGPITEEHKIRLMKESRFYFMLSTYEGFGIAAVEALAAGCCLIHSGRGGLVDAAADHGIKVDINDMDSIISKCLDVYGNPVDYAQMRSGMDFVSRRFGYQSRLISFHEIIGQA